MLEDEILSRFKYFNGDLYYKVDGRNFKADTLVGKPRYDGRRRAYILGKHFYIHHIIWFLNTGELTDEIDHKDGNPSNNNIDNLRKCTHKQNMANLKVRSNKKWSIYKGVTFNKLKNKWLARIQGTHLGYFDTELEAKCAYEEAAKVVFGDFKRGDQ